MYAGLIVQVVPAQIVQRSVALLRKYRLIDFLYIDEVVL